MICKANVMEAVNKGSLYEYTELGRVNGNMLNVVQVKDRTLDFHVHENSDELFYVLEGHFTLEIEEKQTTLFPGDMIVVPKGTRHRPVCTGLVKLLLVDMAGALNDGNCGGTYSKRPEKA
jgi:mannose-6-phosphate isomerase-like protein (cupin superfamily)